VSVAPTSARALAAPDPLVFRRLPVAELAAAPAALGGRLVGPGAGALHAPLLAPEGAALFDAWVGRQPVEERQHGCVRYATDGDWLHGVAEIDDRPFGLQPAAHRAYTDLFELLAESRCPNLLRVWNYLADINRKDDGSDGSERYRQFNAGRQQAFIEARRSAFEGAPAACALGTREGPLRVHFLAGRRPPLAIENPRQVSAYRYPDAYGPRSPTFSRAALVDVGGGRDALFISGTASIVGHATVHLGDVRRQTEESLLNIDTVRRVAAERGGAEFPAGELICTVYVRRPADLPVVREVFERWVGAASAAARDAIYLQADICRAELLVEIEAHGFVRREERA
jgi:enamine deaminase RidA (YjgF/YER057c/UK114 family)